MEEARCRFWVSSGDHLPLPGHREVPRGAAGASAAVQHVRPHRGRAPAVRAPPAELDVKECASPAHRRHARRHHPARRPHGGRASRASCSLLMAVYPDEPEITARRRKEQASNSARSTRAVPCGSQPRGRHHQARREKVSIIHVQEALQGLGRFSDVAVVAERPDEILGHVRSPFVVPNEPDTFRASCCVSCAGVAYQPRDRRRAIRAPRSGPSCARCSPSGEPRGSREQLQEGPAQQEPTGARRRAGTPGTGASRHPELVHGGWTAVAAERWERNATDDYMYISVDDEPPQEEPAEQPPCCCTAGVGREASSAAPRSPTVQRNGGPDIVAYNQLAHAALRAELGDRRQPSDTPTTVLVGVNLGRFTTSPQSNYNQVIGRELLLKSDSLRR